MTGIPEPRFRQADHPRLKVNEWRPDAGAEDLGGGILMSKSVTNCFVVASDAGDVVINTGLAEHGARHRERFEQLLGRKLDVRKVIFTQSHVDHAGGWEAFADPQAELIGQREFEVLVAERTALATFFSRRNARIIRAILDKMARESGKPPSTAPKQVSLTTRFAFFPFLLLTRWIF